MRRSDHPSRPSAITCSRFSALKTLAIPAAGAKPTAHVNVSAPGAALAGFQVSINGRFWVSTEADSAAAHLPKVAESTANSIDWIAKTRSPPPATVQPFQLVGSVSTSFLSAKHSRVQPVARNCRCSTATGFGEQSRPPGEALELSLAMG